MQELEARSGVGRETIRYYIRLGLLPEPERPKPNVAVYGDEHVRRLATIKRLQAERYLPLAFIKTLLDRPSHGEVAGIPGLDDTLTAGLAPGGPTPLAAAARETGVTEAEIQTMAGDKVIFIEDGALSAADMAVVRAWGRAKAAGFNPDNGFYAEDVGVYAETLWPMTAREIERFFTRVPGAFATPEAATLAQAGVEIINGLITAMRTNYLLRRVAELNAREP
ncbi:MerR family transcriptional regulator [Phenylobacterium sp.]|uniref:MerR family transcriptional regulator n=1 Tax=Phenylobacterium sp. TaxID=1871053 RepID=UPI0035B4A150